MRAGWVGNGALQKRLQRRDLAARPIVEALEVTAEDVKDTRPEFEAADSLTGLEVLDQGVVLADAGATPIDHSGTVATDPGDTDITNLPNPSSIRPGDLITAMEVRWGANTDRDQELRTLTVRLDADLDGVGGNPQDVTEWRCQLFRISRESELPFPAEFELEPLGLPRTALPGGPDPEDVVFDLGPNHPKVGDPPSGNDGSLGPRTLIFVWGVNANEATPSNVGWKAETVSSAPFGAHELRAFQYTVANEGGPETGNTVWERLNAVSTLGRLRLDTGAFSDATIQFSGAGNRVDLGEVPTQPVEFTISGDQVADSALEGQVLRDGGDPGTPGDWVTFTDGQTTDDLANVGLRQTYEIRANLIAGTFSSPTLQRLGARLVGRTSLDLLATVTGAVWSFDPVSHRSRITKAVVRVIRDGGPDFRDLATRLASENFLRNLEFDVWVGHPELAGRIGSITRGSWWRTSTPP